MLIEQVVKVLEHNGNRSEVDEMHCDFMTGCGSTDAVFIFKRNTRLLMSFSTWPQLSWRKHLIASHWLSSGRQCENYELMKGYCLLSNPCTCIGM